MCVGTSMDVPVPRRTRLDTFPVRSSSTWTLRSQRRLRLRRADIRCPTRSSSRPRWSTRASATTRLWLPMTMPVGSRPDAWFGCCVPWGWTLPCSTAGWLPGQGSWIRPSPPKPRTTSHSGFLVGDPTWSPRSMRPSPGRRCSTLVRPKGTEARAAQPSTCVPATFRAR